MRKQKGFIQHHFLNKDSSCKNPNQKMEKNNKSGAGFTIIELLIVIAIIGVLAAIVLINVTGYINKGKDAAVKGNVSTLFTDAINFYNESGSFKGVIQDDDYKNASEGIDDMEYTLTESCNNTSDCTGDSDAEWCASIGLKAVSTATYYCVDSTGKKKESATAVCTNGVCPD
jgi:prepilin-type N-terminal cleavage/methylation domain-containing protein